MFIRGCVADREESRSTARYLAGKQSVAVGGSAAAFVVVCAVRVVWWFGFVGSFELWSLLRKLSAVSW